MKYYIFFIILFILTFFLLFYSFMYYLQLASSTHNKPCNIQIHNSDNNEQFPIFPDKNPTYNKTFFEFQQIGILTSINFDNTPIILPLFGKKLNSSRWNYYTASDTNKNLHIDIEYNNKKCKDKYIGCDELYDDTIVFVPVYNQQFRVSLYEYQSFSYPNI